MRRRCSIALDVDLIVDDDSVTAENIAGMLRAWANHRMPRANPEVTVIDPGEERAS